MPATSKKPAPAPPATPPRDAGFGAALANYLFPAYVFLIVAGYFVLRSGVVAAKGNEITVDRALFAAVNAATLTGFQSTIGFEQYRDAGVAAMLLLTFAGTLFSFIVGALAVTRIARLPYTDWQVLRASVFFTAGATALGTLGLLPGRSVPEAIFLAASSFGNSGLHLGHLPPVNHWQTQLVVLPLAIAGGLGLPVLMELASIVVGRRSALSRHSRTVLTVYAGVYLVTAIVLVLVGLMAKAPASSEPVTAVVASASAVAVDARTLGLPLVPVGSMARTIQWVLILVMAVGGAPASTAGGLKVTCLAELFRGVGRSLRGQAPGRSFGIASTWLLAYAGIVAVALLVLLSTDPDVPADRMLFHVVSAASNVGLSFDPISTVGKGLYVLTLTMFLGRVVPLLIVWWQADTTTDGDTAVA
jgi:Trk-type K+ transport system membrane component